MQVVTMRPGSGNYLTYKMARQFHFVLFKLNSTKSLPRKK